MNWGQLFRLCCFMLPMPMTIFSFLLAIFVLTGNTTNAPFAVDNYFLRLNVSGIGSLATNIPGGTSAEALGLHDFYQTGLWNFCQGYYDIMNTASEVVVVTDCFPGGSNYYFDPIAIVSTQLLPPYTVVFIQTEVDATDKIHNTSNWLKSAFLLTAIFAAEAVIVGPLTRIWHQKRLVNCIPVCSMCIAAIFSFCGAVTATVVYFGLKNSFKDDIGLNIEADIGRQMFAWVWLGFGTSVIATSQWCCVAICCPGGHRRRRVDEVGKPFSQILVQSPWIGGAPYPSTPTIDPDSTLPRTGGIPLRPLAMPEPRPAGVSETVMQHQEV